MQTFKVPEDSVGIRLDSFLAVQIPELSRSSVRKLSDEYKILINGKIEKASYKLRLSDKIQVDYKVGKKQGIPSIDLPILYEDDNCIVINKPIGVLSHSKGAFNPEATVATFIQSKVKNIDNDRAGIVHRLDRATSGVMIVAKTPEALSFLQKQFSQRRVKKNYVAVIQGTLTPLEAIIDMPIERNPKKPQTFRVGANGKPATTEYRTLESNNEYSLIKLIPTTGRTHQLRVHLNHLKHPIVGDDFYDGEKYTRLMLHALTLEITLPGGVRKVFETPMPEEFTNIMSQSHED